MGSDLPKEAWGRSILTWTERTDVSDVVSKAVLTLQFGSVTLEWFDSTEAKAESLFTKALFCPMQGNHRGLKNSWRRTEDGEHSGAPCSEKTSRKFHSGSNAGTLKMIDEPCVGKGITVNWVNSKLSQEGNQDWRACAPYRKGIIFFSSKFQLQIFCRHNWNCDTGNRTQKAKIWNVVTNRFRIKLLCFYSEILHIQTHWIKKREQNTWEINLR